MFSPSRASSSLKEALQKSYRTKDKLPPNIDGRQLPIVEVQLSLVESVREKNKRVDEKKEDDDEKQTSGKEASSTMDTDKHQQASSRKITTEDKDSDKPKTSSLPEREENNSLRYYEDWHNVREENISVDKVFGEGDRHASHVLVLGPAGIGKTTLSQFIAHKWSKGELWPEVDCLFWLPLRNLGKEKYQDEKVSPAQVLHENCLSITEQSKISISDIQQVLSASTRESEETGSVREPVNVLMVLDGFDEVAPHLGSTEEPTHVKVLFDNLSQIGKVVLTSRPHQLDPSLLTKFERQLENRGFSSEQVKTYVTHYFTTLTPPQPELAQSLLRWLETNARLSGMSHVPVTLSLLCAVWHERGKEQEDEKASAQPIPQEMNLTSLYHEMVDYLLKRYLREKRGVDLHGKDMVWVRQQCDREIHFLSYLAYRGLVEKKIHLHGRWVEKVLGDWKKLYGQSEFSFEDVLGLGFLSTLESNSTEEVSKTNISKAHYFLHLSFQEYFAALYLLSSLQTGQGYRPHWEAATFITNEKYNPRYAMVFTFAAGLAHLESTSPLPTQTLWTLFLAPPIDMTGLGQLQLMLRCLGESDFDKRTPHLSEIERQLAEGFSTAVERYLDKGELEVERLFTRDWVPLLSDRFSRIVDKGLSVLPSATLSTDKKLFGKVNMDVYYKRKRALKLLGHLKKFAVRDDILNTLVKTLDDKDAHVRRRAAATLGNMGEKAARENVIDALIKALDDRDTYVLSTAIEALGNMGEKAAREDVIDGLIKALGNSAMYVRHVAAAALGNMGEKAAREDVIDGLIKALSNRNSIFMGDRYVSVSSAAAETLSYISEKIARDDILNSLLKLLSDSDTDVRRVAAEALGNMGERAVREDVTNALLNAFHNEQRDTEMLNALEKMGEKTIPALIEALNDRSGNIARKVAAAWAFQRMGEKAAREDVINALLKTLGDSDNDSYVRGVVAAALGKMGEKATRDDIITALLNALSDNDRSLICTAAEALGNVGEKAAREDVITALIIALNDSDMRVRRAAARALGKMGEKAAREKVIVALLNALGDNDSWVRDAAVETFGSMSKKALRDDTLNALVKALGNSDWRVNRAAAEALGKMGKKAAREDIINMFVKALGDSDSYVRNAAAVALGNMGEKAPRDDVLNVLVKALGEKYLRHETTVALGNMGEKAARKDIIQTLIKILGERPTRDYDYDMKVRLAVVETFMKMGEAIACGDVLSALLKALWDTYSDIKHNATIALDAFPFPKMLIDYKFSHLWTDEPRSLAILSLLQGISWVMKEEEMVVVIYTSKTTETIKVSSKLWLKALSEASKKRAKARGLPHTSCLSKKEIQALQQYLNASTPLAQAPRLTFSAPAHARSHTHVSLMPATKGDLEKLGKQLEQKQDKQSQHLSVKLDDLRGATETIHEDTNFIRHQNEQILSTVKRIETTVDAIAAEQQKQIAEWQKLLENFSAQKKEILKEVGAEEKEAPQPKKVFDQPLVQQFYEEFKKSLDDFYTLAQLIAQGKVTPDPGMAGKATTLVRKAADLIPVPYVPLAVGLLCSVADSVNKHSKIKEAQESTLFLSSTISDGAAKEIARRYQHQITSLTEKGVIQLASCARERVIGYMTSLNTKDAGHITQADNKKVALLVEGVIQGNPFTLKNTEIEVHDKNKNKNWRAEGLFRRSGLELSDGSRYVALPGSTTQHHFWQKKQKKSPLHTHLAEGTEEPKYGYRYGEHAERVRYGFNHQTRASQNTFAESKDEFPSFKVQVFYEQLQSLLETRYLQSKLILEGKVKPASIVGTSIDLLQDFKLFDMLAGKMSDEIQSQFGIDTSTSSSDATSKTKDKTSKMIETKIDEREAKKARPILEMLKNITTPLAHTLTQQCQEKIATLPDKHIQTIAHHFYTVLIQLCEEQYKQDPTIAQQPAQKRVEILLSELKQSKHFKEPIKFDQGQKISLEELFTAPKASTASATPHGANPHILMHQPKQNGASAPTGAILQDVPTMSS